MLLADILLCGSRVGMLLACCVVYTGARREWYEGRPPLHQQRGQAPHRSVHRQCTCAAAGPAQGWRLRMHRLAAAAQGAAAPQARSRMQTPHGGHLHTPTHGLGLCEGLPLQDDASGLGGSPRSQLNVQRHALRKPLKPQTSDQMTSHPQGQVVRGDCARPNKSLEWSLASMQVGRSQPACIGCCYKSPRD